MDNKDDGKKERIGLGAYVFTLLFSWLMYKLVGKWLKKYDVDLKKDGMVLYILVLIAAWFIGLALLILAYLGWVIYSAIAFFCNY